MKMNKKIIRLKRFIKQIVMASEARQSQPMACLKAGKPISLLLALTIILSLFLVAVPMAGIAEATDYYVRTDGNNSNDGLVNDAAHAWLTIQHAVDTVASGDTINVADGTYTISSEITVNKGVTITGNVSNPGNVVVQYDPVANSLIFNMRASNTTIQGVKTTSGKSGFWFDQSVVTGCTVSHCIIDTVNEYGIYMKNGGSGHTIDSCTISNTGQTYAPAPAVLIENCLDVTFSNNTLSSISDKGVYVRVCNAGSVADRVEVTGNSISGCAYSCIQVYQSPYTYIYDNTITSTSDKGLNIIGPNASSQAARVILEGNNISGCPWGGILLTHDRYTYIYNNTISTDDKGISIANGENVTSSAERIIVEGNNVSGTKYPGIQVAYAVPYTYIHNNTLSGCNYYGDDGTGDWDYASIHVAEDCGNTIVDSNDISDCINGIQVWGNDCEVTNNTIYNMGLTYADTKGTGDGTYYNSGIIIGTNWLTNNFKPTGTTITGNNIHDNYWGLYVRDYATLSTGDPSVLNVTAEENWWGDDSGPHNATSNPDGTGDAVSDNVDYDPWYTDEGMTTLSNAIAEVWVDDNYTEGNCDGHTWLVDAFDNIQDGINGVDEGGTVYVAAGMYNEGITGINKTLTIIGATAPSKPIINPTEDTGTENAIGSSGRGWFQVTEATVDFKSLVFDGTGKNIRTAIHYHENSTGGTVENCDFINIAHESLYHGRGINNYGQHVEVLSCTFGNIQRIGIFTYNTTATTLIDNCAYVGKGDGDWLDYGIEFSGGGSGTVDGCDISACTGVASVDDSISAGVLATDYYGTGTVATVKNSTFTGNTHGIYVGYNSTDATVLTAHFNNFSGNTYGIANGGAVEVDATNNWWGDASGPKQVTTNPSATGDEVSDNVDYDPWYTDEAMTTLSNEADIISYKFEADNNAALSVDVSGTVDPDAHTVSLTVPYGTDVRGLVASFDLSAGATAKIGGTDQVSGTTTNDFTSPVTYTITSLDETTAQDWTVTVTLAAASNVATLSDLSLSAGTLSPTFESAITDYTAAVANSITSITVTPTANDTNATIKVNGTPVASSTASGAISLDVGENTITTIVTAQDGTTTKTYTVTVTRAASNVATLSNLTVDGTTISGFSPSTLTYNKVLPYGTTEVPTVAATTTDSNASKVITQAANITGTEAERTATVVVTAEDGTTTKTYKVIFGSIKVTITKTGPTTANQGNNITYTITYKNEGTFNTTNVVITETYPSEVKYVSANPAPDSGFNNKWTIGTLAPDAESTIKVTVHIK